PSLRSSPAPGPRLGVHLFVGVGGQGTLTLVPDAVIAPGRPVVAADVNKVKHPTGVVAGDLLGRRAARGRGGAVLNRHVETQVRSNLAIVLKAMDELAARRARDEAERDG
ncbi:HlyD family type I secretion periplasmic adaptor subunit, partial [Methylobacterium sp. J-078]|nr:HlyD family type I secretion periplasmic adaptor subunit [Methylobacterium sp. J-078]